MNIIPISGIKPILGQEAEVRQQAPGSLPFSDLLRQSMENLQEAQQASRQDAYDLAMGTADDLAAISINSSKATAALELTVEVATRAVNAYKEILQMQI